MHCGAATHHDEGVREALYPETHGAVSEVAPLRLLNRIEVDVDHAVQVSRHHLRHLLVAVVAADVDIIVVLIGCLLCSQSASCSCRWQ